MKIHKYNLIFILCLGLLGSGHLTFAQDYVTGEEDILKITVYGHPDLTTVARISGNGVINFPLIGDVRVMGMTVPEISSKISTLLADGYIIEPQVSVFIEEYRSKKTIIMGQVAKPGVYVLSGRTTFIELLSKAGGLTREAGDKAVVKRKATLNDNSEKMLIIDLKKLIAEGDPSQDIPLMDSDNIYISKAGIFFITGEVKRPDSYRYEDGLTLSKVVAMAGGFTDKASPGRIRIIRKVSGKEQVIDKVKLDDPVLPDDIIVVPESIF